MPPVYRPRPPPLTCGLQQDDSPGLEGEARTRELGRAPPDAAGPLPSLQLEALPWAASCSGGGRSRAGSKAS